MKIRIILLSRGVAIDRQTIEADETSLTDDIAQAIKCWVLKPGDILEIVEVS